MADVQKTLPHLIVLDMRNPLLLIAHLLPVSFLSLLFCLPFQSFFLLIILAARRPTPAPALSRAQSLATFNPHRLPMRQM